MSSPSAVRPPALIAAVGVGLLTLAATGAAAVIDSRVSAAHRAAIDTELGFVAGLAGLALALPGAYLLSRVPRHPLAWILCLTGVHWAADGAASSWLAYATASAPVRPGAALAFWTYQRVGALLLLSLPLVLLFYPDGRLPTGRWRVASLVSLATTALLPLVLLVVPANIGQAASTDDPLPAPLRGFNTDLTTLPLSEAFGAALLTVAYAAVPISLVVPFAVAVRRYRSATGRARARMRWLVWAGVVDVLVMASTVVLPGSWSAVALPVAVGLTAAAVTVGVVAPDLVAIDRLLGGTVRYGTLAVAVVAVDLAVLSLASTVLGARLAERDAALLALLIVMTIYGPLRHRLWRWVRRALLGRRDDPYLVVTGLAEQLERTDAPEDQLLAVVRTVAEAFRTSYVAVEVDRAGGWQLLAKHGTAPAAVQVLPITYRGEAVGRLMLPRDGARVALSARDERLLGDVVRQAAAAARSSDLALALQRSREALVNAREEERRRLRRDLHDGLGRAWALWRCASTPRAIWPVRLRTRPTGCSARPGRTRPPRWPTCAGSCTTYARRPSMTSGWSPPSGNGANRCARSV